VIEDAVTLGLAAVRRELSSQNDTALTTIAPALNPSRPYKPESKGAKSAVISRLAAATGNISKPNILHLSFRMAPCRCTFYLKITDEYNFDTLQ
jgi:hypothetical protein